MSVRGEIKRVLSQDGQRRMIVLLTATSKLFRFVEDTYCTEDGGYWSPSHESGLYESAEAAEQAARSELLWLRDENSK